MFSRLLLNQSETVQLATLRLIEASLPHLNYQQINSVMDRNVRHSLLNVFTNHGHIPCREALFDVLNWMWRNPGKLSESATIDSDELPEMIKHIRPTLLLMMKDGHLPLRERVYEFWNQNENLSVNGRNRLSELLSNMYSPEAQDDWIRFSAHLLLALPRRAPNFKSKLHDSLGNEHFRPMSINTSALQGTFAGTQGASFMNVASSHGGSGATQKFFDPSTQSLRPVGVLQSTQSMYNGNGFSMTQTQDGGASLVSSIGGAWGTQAVLKNFINDNRRIKKPDINQPQPNPNQPNAAFDQPPQFPPPNFGSTPGATQGGENAAYVSVFGPQVLAGASTGGITSRRYRGKARKSEFARSHHATIHQNRKRRQKASLTRSKASRNRNIQIHRQYRSGDLPDVAINLEDFLKPLQALSLRDEGVAKTIICSAGESLIEEMATQEQENFCEAIGAALKQPSVSAPVVSALLSLNQKLWAICPDIIREYVQPNVIADSAIQAKVLSDGIMAIEDILRYTATKTKDKKSRRRARGASSTLVTDTIVIVTDDYSNECWAELCRLYGSMGENDIMLAITREKGYEYGAEDIVEAVENELNGLQDRALKKYNAIDESETISKFEDLAVEEGKKRCNAVLGKWLNSCNEAIEATCRNDMTMDDGHGPRGPEDDNMRILLKDENKDPWALQFFKNSWKAIGTEGMGHLIRLEGLTDLVMQNRAEQEWCINQVPAEFITALLIKGDPLRADSMWEQTYQSILKKWCTSSPLAVNTRRDMIVTLHRLSELRQGIKFLNVVSEQQSGKSNSGARSLLGVLEKRLFNSEGLSANIWDDLMAERQMFVQLAKQHCDPELHTALSDSLGRQYLFAASQCASSCAYLGNVFMRNSAGIARSLYGENQFITYLSTVEFIVSSVEMNLGTGNTNRAMREMKKCKKILDEGDAKITNDTSDDLIMWRRILEARISEVHVAQSNPDNRRACTEHAFDNWREATKMYRNGVEVNKGCSVDKADMLMRYALFCNEQLLRLEEEKSEFDEKSTLDDLGKDAGSAAIVVVRYLLKAISLGSKKARTYIPRVIEIASQYECSLNEFHEHSSRLPIWMFLNVLTPLMVCVTSDHINVVSDLLISLAANYPQALVYPFEMAMDDKEEDLGDVACLDTIRKELHNPLIEKFKAACEFMTAPHFMVKDIRASVPQKIKTKNDKQRLFNAANRLRELNSTERLDKREFGSEFAKFKRTFGSKLEVCAKELERGKVSPLTKLVELSRKDHGKSGKFEIGVYSKWMEKFDSNDYTEYHIEIPGQYSFIDEEPQLDKLSKISNFGGNVLVMKSLRIPKRITLLGDDRKEHRFLVKGGEDLRLDARIEFLFKTMNQLFGVSNASSQHSANMNSKGNLFLKTYEVIPMNSRVGILEWLDNTRPYKGVFDPHAVDLVSKSFQKMFRNATRGDHTNNYSKLALGYDNTSSREKFVELQKYMPKQMLRKYLLDRTATTQAFLMFRKNMVKSMASMSIGGYILGLGDRHMENFLIDDTDGSMILIDFGHAFGNGTMLLAVPELIPFRMSPQFQQVMEPIGIHALIKEDMVKCLDTIRQNASVIENVLNVFIKNPPKDWKDGTEDEIFADARNRIEIAKRKLRGANPMHIMKSLLSLNGKVKQNKKWKNNLFARIDGDNHTTRADFKHNDDLSSSEEVDILLEMAMDPVVLFVQWQGMNISI
eukprot:TRINITY_DN2768_c0_g1_i2.p1 TRINITY_DN2768_c0_g1~~TRINITY_DN2768_c0_g1_i2.p1  ORF type:complete len:1699 (+),score=447.04 TRINITY_DN2768_c0_g1_i2:286-5382(+)